MDKAYVSTERSFTDIRPAMFGDASWYRDLLEPTSADPSAWYVVKDTENEWTERLLSGAFIFAREHGVFEHYQRLFGGIDGHALRYDRALRERRTVSFPIWQIANELIVAMYLERVLGWRFEAHEPHGRGTRRGDWEFRAPDGERVFVEVKCFAEPEWQEVGVHSRPDYRPRIRSTLREAYEQLPEDGRGTLVVLCGHEITRIPFGIQHGDVFQALLGQWQVRFQINQPKPSITGAGPSFRDTFIHGGKHRRLGWVAGISISGLFDPTLAFYAVENPYCHAGVRIAHSAFGGVTRFEVSDWSGTIVSGASPRDAWRKIVPDGQEDAWIVDRDASA